MVKGEQGKAVSHGFDNKGKGKAGGPMLDMCDHGEASSHTLVKEEQGKEGVHKVDNEDQGKAGGPGLEMF